MAVRTASAHWARNNTLFGEVESKLVSAVRSGITVTLTVIVDRRNWDAKWQHVLVLLSEKRTRDVDSTGHEELLVLPLIDSKELDRKLLHRLGVFDVFLTRTRFEALRDQVRESVAQNPNSYISAAEQEQIGLRCVLLCNAVGVGVLRGSEPLEEGEKGATP